MKVFGWFLLVSGFFSFIMAIVAVSVHPELVGQKLSGAIMCLVLGGFLLWRAKKKKEEQEEADKWKNGEH